MPIEIFCSFTRADESLLNRLEMHLSPFQSERVINVWDERKIVAGDDKALEIEKHLAEAQIILVLVSPDYIALKCAEARLAMERREQGTRVIPIILRHTYYWSETLFRGLIENLQPLPTGAEPIMSSSWNQDEAFFNITEGIHKAIRELSPAPTQEQDRKIAALIGKARKEMDHSIQVTRAREEMDHLIRLYKDLRYFITASFDKTRNMESVRKSMQEWSKRAEYTSREIENFLLSLDEGERLAGLAILKWRGGVDNFEQVVDFMKVPRSPFEHYHTLEVLRKMKPHLTDSGLLGKLQAAVHDHVYDSSADSKEWPVFCREVLSEDRKKCE